MITVIHLMPDYGPKTKRTLLFQVSNILSMWRKILEDITAMDLQNACLDLSQLSLKPSFLQLRIVHQEFKNKYFYILWCVGTLVIVTGHVTIIIPKFLWAHDQLILCYLLCLGYPSYHCNHSKRQFSIGSSELIDWFSPVIECGHP